MHSGERAGWCEPCRPTRQASGLQPALAGFSTANHAYAWSGCFSTLAGLVSSCNPRSKERVQGMCAAHIAALQTAVQMLGGASCCAAALPHIAADFHAICDTWGPLLTDASVTALFGGVVTQLAPNLAEVRCKPGRPRCGMRLSHDEPTIAANFRSNCQFCWSADTQAAVGSGRLARQPPTAGCCTGSQWRPTVVA